MPNANKNILEDIAPKKPKKFFISTLFAIFPTPGSLGLCVKILISTKDDKQIKIKPTIIFDKNSFTLPYLNIINNIICNTYRIR